MSRIKDLIITVGEMMDEDCTPEHVAAILGIPMKMVLEMYDAYLEAMTS